MKLSAELCKMQEILEAAARRGEVWDDIALALEMVEKLEAQLEKAGMEPDYTGLEFNF